MKHIMKTISVLIMILIFNLIFTVNGVAKEIQITIDTAGQSYPSISGNRIVYQDDRSGLSDIYMYNLSTNTEKQITSDTALQVYSVMLIFLLPSIYK